MALNAITGKPLWRVQTGLEISGGPGVDGELVFVGTRDAELVALSSETGEEQWRAPVSSEILSVPKSALGVVVVHTVDGKLFGFDVLDGRQIWLYERPIPVLTLHGSSSPAVSGGRVLVGFASGKLVALDILNGTLLWETSVTLPSGRSELERMVDIDGDPLVMGGLVFVTTYQGQLAAVGEDNGSVFWRKDLSAYSDIRADWRGLYVSDAAGQVWAFDPGNGVALWKNKDLLNRGLSAPAVLGDYVVVGDFEGYLHWLSSVDGGLVARVRVGSEPILSPIVADDRLYVYGTGGIWRFSPLVTPRVVRALATISVPSILLAVMRLELPIPQISEPGYNGITTRSRPGLIPRFPRAPEKTTDLTWSAIDAARDRLGRPPKRG